MSNSSSDTNEDLTMPLDAFVRSIAINRHVGHCLFLGAGASLSSGIPSAEKCMMEWKAKIFSSSNPGLEKQVGHAFLPAVQRKIQTWLDKQGGYPADGSEEEYGVYFEHCYPVADDRRAYFQNIIKTASPGFGYRLLALLAESGIFNSVWSTNFDGLPARVTAGSSVVPIEVGLDSIDRIERQPRKDELLCVAVHGDYRYDALKNTPAELQQQDATLRQAFAGHIRERTMIVAGYSGRDDSVMEAMSNALGAKGSGRLYWCGYQNPEPPARVAELIRKARSAGRGVGVPPPHGLTSKTRGDILRAALLYRLPRLRGIEPAALRH
jgi:hypothetical protein